MSSAQGIYRYNLVSARLAAIPVPDQSLSLTLCVHMPVQFQNVEMGFEWGVRALRCRVITSLFLLGSCLVRGRKDQVRTLMIRDDMVSERKSEVWS